MSTSGLGGRGEGAGVPVHESAHAQLQVQEVTQKLKYDQRSKNTRVGGDRDEIQGVLGSWPYQDSHSCEVTATKGFEIFPLDTR